MQKKPARFPSSVPFHTVDKWNCFMIDVDVGCIAERSGGVRKNVFLTQSDGKKKNLLVLLWNGEIF